MLKAPYSEDFILIFNGDDGFKVYFDNEMIVDRWETCCDEI
jgi:hypothetical protein